MTFFSRARLEVPHFPAPESITNVVRFSEDIALRDTVEKYLMLSLVSELSPSSRCVRTTVLRATGSGEVMSSGG